MGKHIEIYAEVFDEVRWKPAEPLIANEFHDPEDDRSDPEDAPQCLYSGSGRPLCEILVDGISALRGLPGDICPEIGAFERPRREDGMFDHSWLSLEELLAFDWDAVIQKTALFDPDLAPLFEDNPLGFPYARWPNGRSIHGNTFQEGGVEVRWRETPTTLAGSEFMEQALPKLRSFGPASLVRIVFWFHC